MYKTHPQTAELIHNSKAKQAKRLRTLLFVLLAFSALIFGGTRLIKEHAQQFRDQIKIQQLNDEYARRQEMIKTNVVSERATRTLNQIKALTANYNNN